MFLVLQDLKERFKKPIQNHQQQIDKKYEKLQEKKLKDNDERQANSLLSTYVNYIYYNYLIHEDETFIIIDQSICNMFSLRDIFYYYE